MVELECSCRGKTLFLTAGPGWTGWCEAWVSRSSRRRERERVSVRVPVFLCMSVNVNGCLRVEAKQPLFVSLGWTWTSSSFKSSFKHRHKHRTFFCKWVISTPVLPHSSSLWCLFLSFSLYCILIKKPNTFQQLLIKARRWKNIHISADWHYVQVILRKRNNLFHARVLSSGSKFLWNSDQKL